ncbi:MAG: hypothetical protein ACUVRY_00620 [Thermoanaerobaculaceae bacterium]
MTDSRLPLDVDLVWGAPPVGSVDAVPPRLAGFGRIWLAVAADLGVSGLACVLTLALAWGQGAALAPNQVAVALIFALLVLGTALQGGALWCFQASLGMRLAGTRFSQALTPGRAAGVWLALLLAAPLLGLPMVVGKRGERLLEKVAGSPALGEATP